MQGVVDALTRLRQPVIGLGCFAVSVCPRWAVLYGVSLLLWAVFFGPSQAGIKMASRLVMATESDWAVLAAHEEERQSIRSGLLECLEAPVVDDLLAGRPVEVDVAPQHVPAVRGLLIRNQRLLRAATGVL